MTRNTSILDQLKAEIRKAEKRGITRYRLSQLSGVTQASLSRLMAGTLPTPRVDTVEKLAKGLQLRIVLEKRAQHLTRTK